MMKLPMVVASAALASALCGCALDTGLSEDEQEVQYCGDSPCDTPDPVSLPDLISTTFANPCMFPEMGLHDEPYLAFFVKNQGTKSVGSSSVHVKYFSPLGTGSTAERDLTVGSLAPGQAREVYALGWSYCDNTDLGCAVTIVVDAANQYYEKYESNNTRQFICTKSTSDVYKP
jgi:hypothetical protein